METSRRPKGHVQTAADQNVGPRSFHKYQSLALPFMRGGARGSCRQSGCVAEASHAAGRSAILRCYSGQVRWRRYKGSRQDVAASTYCRVDADVASRSCLSVRGGEHRLGQQPVPGSCGPDVLHEKRIPWKTIHHTWIRAFRRKRSRSAAWGESRTADLASTRPPSSRPQ